MKKKYDIQAELNAFVDLPPHRQAEVILAAAARLERLISRWQERFNANRARYEEIINSAADTNRSQAPHFGHNADVSPDFRSHTPGSAVTTDTSGTQPHDPAVTTDTNGTQPHDPATVGGKGGDQFTT